LSKPLWSKQHHQHRLCICEAVANDTICQDFVQAEKRTSRRSGALDYVIRVASADRWRNRPAEEKVVCFSTFATQAWGKADKIDIFLILFVDVFESSHKTSLFFQKKEEKFKKKIYY
jgi:hypothetical protein